MKFDINRRRFVAIWISRRRNSLLLWRLWFWISFNRFLKSISKMHYFLLCCDITMSISEFLKFLKFLNSERNDRVEDRKSFDLTWHVLLLKFARFINLNLHNYYFNQNHIYVCFNFNFWHNNNYSIDRRVV